MIKMLPLISPSILKEVDAPWTQHGPADWSIDASDVKAHGGERRVMVPGIGKPITFLRWNVKKDREGEISAWIAKAAGRSFTIWND